MTDMAKDPARGFRGGLWNSARAGVSTFGPWAQPEEGITDGSGSDPWTCVRGSAQDHSPSGPAPDLPIWKAVLRRLTGRAQDLGHHPASEVLESGRGADRRGPVLGRGWGQGDGAGPTPSALSQWLPA